MPSFPSAKLEKQFIHLQAPKRGKNYARAMLAAGELYVTPDAFKGRIVNFCCLGTNGFIATNTDNTLSLNADMSGFAGNVLTPDVNTPFPLPQATIVPYYFDENDDYFFVMCATGTVGTWYASPGSPGRDGTP